jgi:hypothetical protein
MKSFINRGERQATKKKIYDFSAADAIQFITKIYPTIQMPSLTAQQQKQFLTKGSILQEAIQTAYNKAAFDEDQQAISNITIPSTMLKLFAGVVKADFTAANDIVINFDEEIDPLVKQLDFNNLIIEHNNNNKIIQQMEIDCIECERHLRQTLSEEASKLPGEGVQYQYDKDSNALQTGTFDLNRLPDEVTQQKGDFAKGKIYYNSASSKLIAAAHSYQAVKRLHQTLNSSQEPSAIKRLENYRKEYGKKETQVALKFNPDSVVKRFFENAWYHLVKFFKPNSESRFSLMPPPRRLAKKTKELEEASSKKRKLK